MSEHMYGVSKVRPPRAVAREMEQASKAAGGWGLVEATLPGTGYQRWYTGPNRGFPFDDRLARETYEALDAMPAYRAWKASGEPHCPPRR